MSSCPKLGCDWDDLNEHSTTGRKNTFLLFVHPCPASQSQNWLGCRTCKIGMYIPTTAHIPTDARAWVLMIMGGISYCLGAFVTFLCCLGWLDLIAFEENHTKLQKSYQALNCECRSKEKKRDATTVRRSSKMLGHWYSMRVCQRVAVTRLSWTVWSQTPASSKKTVQQRIQISNNKKSTKRSSNVCVQLFSEGTEGDVGTRRAEATLFSQNGYGKEQSGNIEIMCTRVFGAIETISSAIVPTRHKQRVSSCSAVVSQRTFLNFKNNEFHVARQPVMEKT